MGYKADNNIPTDVLRDRACDFENMSKLVKPYFDEIGAPLGFSGYKKTLNDYIYSDSLDLEGLFNLTKDISIWMNYMGEILSITEFLYLQTDNKKSYYEAFNISEKNVKAYKELNEVRIKHQRLKLYLKHIEIQYKMFKTCFYSISKTYNESLGSYLYRSYD